VAIETEETGEKVDITGYSVPIRKFVVKNLFQTVSYNNLNKSET
jgi:hypothetical protein